MAAKKTDNSLEAALADIDKEWGAGSIFLLSDVPESDVPSMKTGILPLDRALGRGLPRGRMIEIYGPPQSGKSTIAMSTIAQAQVRGEICAWIDAEHALDVPYAQEIGMNTTKMLVSAPDTGEQAFYTMEKLCRSGEVSVIVVDSVAALLPRNMREAEYGDAMVGMHPQFLSKSVPKLIPALDNGVTSLIFINQLRESIGKQYGSPEYRPGGKAVPYYSSTCLDVRRIRTDKDSNDDPFSHRTRVKVTKHRSGIPYRTCEFDLELGRGVPRENWILDLAVETGLIVMTGSWFKEAGADKNFANGRAAVLAKMREDALFTDTLESQIMEAIA